MRRTGMTSAVAAVALVIAAGCAGDESDGFVGPASPTSTAEDASPTTPASEPSPTPPTSSPISTYTSPPTSAASPGRPTVEFPPQALPLRADGEITLGQPDLVRLAAGGEWLFAVEPPSVVIRIDPDTGDTERLDLDLGSSREGPVRHAYAADALWVLGGPFRDTLVEVDPVTMTETHRIQLDQDHAIRHGGPVDTLWLTTLRGVRPVELSTGEVGDIVPVEVDPAGIAVDGTDVWVTLPAAAQVARIDALDGSVELIDTEPGPSGIALTDDTVWVTHPPTASISRIDAVTGQTLGVVDLDIGAGTASVTNIPGLNVSDDSVWVLTRLDGSAYRPIMIRLEADTGHVRSARTIQVEGNTWTATGGQLWFHRADSGSLVAVAIDDFDDAPPTDLGAPTSTTTPSNDPPPPSAAPTADEREIADAFEAFVDPTVASDTLDIGPLAAVRDELVQLLEAQVGGEALVSEVVVEGDTGAAVFDVVVEGDTVILPGLEFAFERTPGASTWAITESSLCAVAEGVGITCP